MRSTTGPWSCSISLQIDEDGRRTVLPFGSTIHLKSHVEISIRRAQAAILSPHRSEADFLSKNEHDLKTEVDPQRLQFSKNSVRVEIMDPESPNLDFVDLPGERFVCYNENRSLIFLA
jgi:vacuolar protein sorting-associated protein 1